MTDTIEVLVVDDDEIDRLALSRALAKAGFDNLVVTEAERATDAFTLISSDRFACAYFDVRLPDRDGVALLRDVRAAGVRTPVVVLTGFGDEQTVLDAMKAGATDYVAKSNVSPERIGQTLRAALRLRDADRATAAARHAEQRYAEQLRRLAEAAVAVSNAVSVPEIVRVAATHACRITGSECACVELREEFDDKVEHESEEDAWRDAAGAAVASPEDTTRVALSGAEGAEIGEIVLAKWAETGGDGVVLDQLARLVAGALESRRLFEQAQTAMRTREDMLAIVSHDLRNPLHTISLSASFLSEVFGDQLAETAKQQIGIIRRAVDRANGLIQDLLDVSRIDAGAFTVTADVIPAHKLLDDAMEAMAPTAVNAEITLTSTVAPDLPSVCADRARVLQIFTNLVGNAVKFTPKGGSIAMSATSTEPGTVRFSVRDTGSGIAPENLPHVFDRFWQARTRGRAGAGLGLAIARGIAEAHGGEIGVESTVGVGTEMYFTLPAVASAPAPATNSAPA